ncbi:DNA-directed RNA polymerase subunit beta [Sporosarcina sp. HYO08]|uniref:DNA-directed RNA polymerase subunit beta n=1 Tax=Sporosarcina sp. HYO08 TaxID=1759557 RepID=UPI000792A10E|nr:DNA-directed RNA polymerase subunit beta [Sporosarcina sp. HYO08]KXH83996.1 hypothetical protein AU377_04385 [Sporosarcina sp. HYO08]
MTDEKNDVIKQSNTTPPLPKRRKEKTPERDNGTPKKPQWVQVRIFPIWLRIILVLVLLVGAAIVGAMIGYGIIGDGNPGDVLKKETWVHILDIINGKTK